jgi:hypothetical protein
MTNQEKNYQLKFNGANVLESFEKLIREKNAKKFINELNKTFNEAQTSNLINLLSDYEKFLKLND